MKYVVEYQMGGEITIDTEGTDWSIPELEGIVQLAIDSSESSTIDRIIEEFDDCEIVGEPAVSEYTLRRLS